MHGITLAPQSYKYVTFEFVRWLDNTYPDESGVLTITNMGCNEYEFSYKPYAKLGHLSIDQKELIRATWYRMCKTKRTDPITPPLSFEEQWANIVALRDSLCDAIDTMSASLVYTESQNKTTIKESTF